MEPMNIGDVVGVPEIGEVFLVPSVDVLGFWIPVIGPAHTDPEYFPHIPRHFHRDLRFIPDEELCIGGVMHLDAALHFSMQVVVPETDARQGPIPILRTCVREMPVFPTYFADRYRRSENAVLPRMERDFAHARIKLDCAVCPHRGIPLNGIRPRNGLIEGGSHAQG